MSRRIDCHRYAANFSLGLAVGAPRPSGGATAIPLKNGLASLCRRHGIGAHSSVVDQAKKHEWQRKREAYQTKASESFVAHHADRQAAREAEVRDHALEAIERFRPDMRATKNLRQPDGTIAEEPVMLMTPKDLALLIDRLQVLCQRPSIISQRQGHTVTSGIPVDALRQFIDLTRGGEPPTHVSPLPRSPRRLDD